jgi:hypothetical protein
LNDRKKRHSLQFPLPPTIVSFFKSKGHIGEEFECRTEAVVGGTTYRAHPNFQGAGPWCDFAMVKFEHTPLHDDLADDHNLCPAKMLGFFRLLPGPVDDDFDFSVLVHGGAHQVRDSPICKRRTLLTRSWLYEVAERGIPRPTYVVAGGTKSNIVLGKHTFAVEEKPGFHLSYDREEHKRFIVLSDMRQEWPHLFINGR